MICASCLWRAKSLIALLADFSILLISIAFLLVATIPTIHLNGTGFTTLRDEYTAAYDAISKARDALADATLHGRDYYPQADGAYGKALDERNEALAKLSKAHQYVAEMLEGICNQCR